VKYGYLSSRHSKSTFVLCVMWALKSGPTLSFRGVTKKPFWIILERYSKTTLPCPLYCTYSLILRLFPRLFGFQIWHHLQKQGPPRHSRCSIRNYHGSRKSDTSSTWIWAAHFPFPADCFNWGSQAYFFAVALELLALLLSRTGCTYGFAEWIRHCHLLLRIQDVFKMLPSGNLT
jgi:hypothetical protein